MSLTEQTPSPLEKKLSLHLSLDRINAQVEQKLKKIARTARLPGFRPGKVPMKIIVQSYGSQAHSDVLQEELARTFGETVKAERLRVAGVPRIVPATDSQGGLTFDAIFEVFPDITFGDFTALEVQQTVFEVGDADIDRTIDLLRSQRVTYEVAERATQAGDMVTMDFVGKLDGTAFDHGSATDYAFVLGKKQMLPAFEDAALGLKAGEGKTFDLTFPDDYHGKDVAGKTAQFEITIKKVEAPSLPPLDDAFVESLGITEGGLDGMRADVKDNLTREMTGRAKMATKQAVMDSLLNVAEFAVPKSLIDLQVQELKNAALENFKQRGIANIDTIPLPDEVFRADAERRVRLGLIVSDLVKSHDLQAKPDQVRAHIEEVAQSYESPVEVMQWYFADRSRLEDVEAAVLEDNVVEWVLARAKIIPKPLALDEVMENKQ
ncbi:MAG: trigger factor [Burkholderiaceae bacterium]